MTVSAIEHLVIDENLVLLLLIVLLLLVVVEVWAGSGPRWLSFVPVRMLHVFYS